MVLGVGSEQRVFAFFLDDLEANNGGGYDDYIDPRTFCYS
jgi:hypothetical protein